MRRKLRGRIHVRDKNLWRELLRIYSNDSFPDYSGERERGGEGGGRIECAGERNKRSLIRNRRRFTFLPCASFFLPLIIDNVNSCSIEEIIYVLYRPVDETSSSGYKMT